MSELVLIVSFVVALYIGWKFREYVAIKNLDRAMHMMEAHRDSSIVDIKIEKIEGQLFVYNRKTSEYMAHASTKDALEDMLRHKYPGKNFNASPEDITKLHESV